MIGETATGGAGGKGRRAFLCTCVSRVPGTAVRFRWGGEMALEDTAAVNEGVKEGDAEVRRRRFVLQEPGGEIGTSRAPVGRGRFVD